MRKLTQFNEAIKANKINVKENAVNYLSVEDLKKYLKVANNFLSDETKDIINYLIVNNKDYISELSADNEENALAGFYNAGEPKKENLKELWKKIETVYKSGRILEIPVLQTKEEFDSIIDYKVPADKVILDLDSEAGKTDIIKRYEPLVHKIVRQFYGKSTLEYDDLKSAANMGLIYAMKGYGKRSDKTKAEDKKIMQYTFGQYAAQIIHHWILGEIRTTAHTVRVPISAQNAEKKETGKISKNKSISGDKKVGINNSDDGNKTVFDFIDAQEYADTDLDKQDLDKLWKEIYDAIIDKFGQKVFDIWCSFYGVNDYKQLQNKELASKYNVSNSSITYYCMKVNNFIQNDKTVFAKLKDVYELTKECLNDMDRHTRDENDEYCLNSSAQIYD